MDALKTSVMVLLGEGGGGGVRGFVVLENDAYLAFRWIGRCAGPAAKNLQIKKNLSIYES